ncbi:unnamed protein product [Miscanthus lutarioriparius]|uniref:Uncharacterized protein n=1 Tax=Miscanthus lutarioriparius TaxID=422564 RepID=A0A811R8C1_9POAL|nr:unnamed protein product [Miscanthus lutarioriparius]
MTDFKLPDNDSSKEEEVERWWSTSNEGSSVESSPDQSPLDFDNECFFGDGDGAEEEEEEDHEEEKDDDEEEDDDDEEAEEEEDDEEETTDEPPAKWWRRNDPSSGIEDLD